MPEPNPGGLCMCGCGERAPIARQTHVAAGWVKGKPIRFLQAHVGRPLAFEQEVEACYLYQTDGLTCPEIGRMLGVPRKAVAATLERHGIPRNASTRAWSEERRAALRTYDCDHGFFETIDSEDKAYWLGFLAADGCNTNGFMRVDLSSQDRGHLVRFKNTLRSGHPVHDRPRNEGDDSFSREGATMSYFAIKSPRLTAGLAKHGVVPRKTFVLQWPDNLPDELLRHYLRGYSDGDGSFCVSPSKYVRKSDGGRGTEANWQLVGNERFCKGAQDHLVEAVKVRHTKLYPSPNARNEGIVQLRYGGNKQLARICRFMYADATVYLPRKHQKVAHLL